MPRKKMDMEKYQTAWFVLFDLANAPGLSLPDLTTLEKARMLLATRMRGKKKRSAFQVPVTPETGGEHGTPEMA